MKELLRQLPQYDTVYLGDNGRTPYGGHDAETILSYSRQAVEHLFAQDVKLIVVGCNTVSAVALRALQEEYIVKPQRKDRNILGVIFPLIEKAVELSKTKRIGVVGTRATVASEAYVHELKKLCPEGRIVQQACPLLVPFIEEGWDQKPEAKMILKKYLRPLQSYNLDTLILGCTHYPLMHEAFQRIMGKNVHVLDTGPTVAASLVDYLKRHPEIENGLSKSTNEQGATRRFLTTGDAERFKTLGSRFLGQGIVEVKRVKLQ